MNTQKNTNKYLIRIYTQGEYILHKYYIFLCIFKNVITQKWDNLIMTALRLHGFWFKLG